MFWFSDILLVIILFLAFMPTFVNNPIVAMLAFILVFLLVACILLFIDIEFLAFVYAIVYIGAVAVLFLFVIMLLPLSLQYRLALKFFNVIFLVLLLLVTLFSLLNVVKAVIFRPERFLFVDALLPELTLEHADTTLFSCFSGDEFLVSELHQISENLYNLCGVLFIETAFILVLALIAVIILTKPEQK